MLGMSLFYEFVGFLQNSPRPGTFQEDHFRFGEPVRAGSSLAQCLFERWQSIIHGVSKSTMNGQFLGWTEGYELGSLPGDE